MLSSLNKLTNKTLLYFYYICIVLLFSWVMYICSMATWNTFCKGCPSIWYKEHVEPILPRPIPKPVIPIEEEEDWEDEDWDDDDDDEETDWR